MRLYEAQKGLGEVHALFLVVLVAAFPNTDTAPLFSGVVCAVCVAGVASLLRSRD